MPRKETNINASVHSAAVPRLRGAARRGSLPTVRLKGVASRQPVPPLEREIVARIVRELRALPGCVVRKRHGAGWGFAGDPDIYGSINGRHFEIEVKRPGGRLTRLQELRLAEWRGSGAITGVAHSADEALAILTLGGHRTHA
jgi:hypothetical protein